MSKLENEKEQDSQNLYDKKYGSRINHSQPKINLDDISGQDKNIDLFVPSIEDQKFIATKNVEKNNIQNEDFKKINLNNQNNKIDLSKLACFLFKFF